MASLKIVKGKEYKVKDGDTLAKIAGDNGITLKQLAKFNFGTEEDDKINLALRDKVGSRKKDDKGKYILAKEDDPGIIYIPQDLAPKTFASNSDNNVVVVPIVKKTFITSNCMVKFRPDPAWDGEFGFDWYRNGDTGEPIYESPVLIGGYKAGVPAGLSEADALKNFKAEYETLKTVVNTTPEYLVPYLNIYPEGLPDTPAPPSKVKLQLHVVVEAKAADTLKIEFPTYKADDGSTKSYFALDGGSVDLPTGVGTPKVDITLKCLKEFSAEQEIKVIAETKETNGNYKSYEAGKIKIPPNDAANRRTLKVILVHVKTNIQGTENVGSFSADNKKYLINSLHQALIHADVVQGADLDLRTDDDFIIKDGVYGEFIYDNSAGTANRIDGGVYLDHPKKTGKGSLHAHLRKMYLAKYPQYTADDFTAFIFNENNAKATAAGSVEEIGVKNVVVANNAKITCLAHEALHGLGVYHTHKDTNITEGCRYIFGPKTTDNIMSYSNDRKSTLRWQWARMKSNVKAKP